MTKATNRKRAKPVKALRMKGIGIVNHCGEFWSNRIFGDERAARQHVLEFWCDGPSERRDEIIARFRYVPASALITELPRKRKRK